jgi:hypothetical protein
MPRLSTKRPNQNMTIVNPMYDDADKDSDEENVIKASVEGATTSSSDREAASAVPSKREPCPEESANLWSRAFFNWVGGLMTKSKARRKLGEELEPDDIFQVHKRDAIEKLMPEFRTTLDNARAKVEARKGFAAGSPSRPSHDPKFGSAVIRQAIFDFNFKVLLDLVAWTVAVVVSNGVMPIFILQALQFITSAPENRAPDYVGYLLALGLALSRLFAVVTKNQRTRVYYRIFTRNKHVLMPALLEKTLSLNAADFQRHSSGKIINFLQQDLGFPLVGGITTYVFVFSNVAELLINVVVVYALIGTYALAGCAAMMASTPLSAVMVKQLNKLYKKYCVVKDQRIQQTNELLQVSSRTL